jgi:oligopeptidase B
MAPNASTCTSATSKPAKSWPTSSPARLSSIVWTKDSKGLVYGLANENWRTDNAYYHRLGDDPKNAKLLYKEADIGFGVGVGITAQEDWIIIATGDNVTSEVRLVPADNPLAEPILVAPRKVGREYSVDVRDGTLYIHTNDDHVNFRVATASLESPGRMENADRGFGQALFDRRFAVQGFLRYRRPDRRPRSGRGAPL